MSRYAVWRRDAEDPQTLTGWLFKTDIQFDARLGWRIVGAVGATAVASYFGHVALVSGIFVIWGIQARKPQRRLLQMRQEPSPFETLSVLLVIEDGDLRSSGKDRGWLTLVDGWLVFEGMRTSVAFSRGEATGRVSNDVLRIQLEDGRRCRFHPFDANDRPLLKIMVNDWNLASVPKGKAVLPPRETHPEIWTERFTLWVAGAIACLLSACFGLFFGWPFTILTLVGSAGCALQARECVRRFRNELPQAFPLRAEP